MARAQWNLFRQRVEAAEGRRFADPDAFDRFAATEYRRFWGHFLAWSGIPAEGEAEPVCRGDEVETAVFFPGLRLNYAEALLAGDPERPALLARSGDRRRTVMTRGALRDGVARLATALAGLGIVAGDRVAAIARNGAEAAMAALACAAVGATFSSCAPDMGSFAALARFAPLRPKLLFASLRPERWDRGQPLAERVAALAAGLPGLLGVVALDDGAAPTGLAAPLHRLASLASESDQAPAAWPRLPFNHPLFILFSSGTTGAPKAILHGAGGTLLEHLKEHRLHCDLRPGDRLFFQTSCGWMMWNWQLSALASGAEILLYEGPLETPDAFWRIVAEECVTVFGTNPAYMQHCEMAGLVPGCRFDLGALRAMLSTGSVLRPRQYDWVRHAVKAVPLQSISGGTDIIGCFVLGNPTLPVHRGEAQCRSLGLDVRALPPAEEPGARIGELVCANPFPSRPLGFLNDPGGVRFHASYFAANPGLWTHGDLIERTDRGGWVLHGRSDAVLNVRGIRVGTAEIYAILEDMPEIAEAMAVEQQAEEEPGGSRMLLLVTLRPGLALDAGLTRRIRSELARRGSPALVPSRVLQVGALPVTHSGKRSEAAARDAVNGRAARNRDALRNPDCLDAIAASAAGQDAPAAPAAPAAGPSAEAGLQAICERVLGIAPISPSDNLLELGMDSLAAMSLLLEIERQTGRGLPVSALAEAPSIEGLVRLLNSAEAAPDRQQPQVRHITAAQQPQVRRITAADVEPVCRLLEQGFAEARIPAATWRRLLTHGWDGVAEERGFVLAAGEEILGFLGTIHARRQGAEAGLVCNLSSWYVRPEHRGRGLSMLLAATRDVGRTYTSFTPSPLTRQVLAELGFAPLDTCQLFMPPLLHATTLRYPRPRIEFEPAAVRPLLDAAQRRTFDDHAPYDCLQGVVRDAKAQAYLVVKRRMRELPGRARRAVPARIPYSEVLHCSAPEVLARHLERVKLAVLRRQRTFALVADARLWPEPPAGLRLAARTYARSPVLAAGEIDKLYSELVLLPI